MHELEHALFDHELITLRVIGEWWDLDLTGSQKAACVRALAERLASLDLTAEIDYLGPEEASALRELLDADGRMPVAAFERQHGTVRSMGPGRLEREEPWLDPVSPAESLWYRGLLYRAFDESADSDLVEYYYIPTELLESFETAAVPSGDQERAEAIFLAPVGEPAEIDSQTTAAVDDIVALLAESQKQPLTAENVPAVTSLFLDLEPRRADLLFNLSIDMGLLRDAGEGYRPARKAVEWLRQNREEQLRRLAEGWSGGSWNELCNTPGLICEGSGWQNDPILARTATLDALPRSRAWFDLAELVAFIKETNPDFQRPDGNYETWYIRDASENTFLAGFENWENVEGRLIEFLILGPLKWLGMVETTPGSQTAQTLFRLSERGLDWLEGRPVAEREIKVPIVVGDDGVILVPFNADRYHRFQVARVCPANPPVPGAPFAYHLTPGSLNLAEEQGAGPNRLLEFLAEASQRPLPAGIKRAVERWSQHGVEARLQKVVIVRVRDKEILDKLRSNPKTRQYIGESMGELSAVVRSGDWQELRKTALRLGLMLEYTDLSDASD